MANGTTRKKGTPKGSVKAARGSSVVGKKGTPWGTIIAVVGIVALLASVITYYMVKSAPKRDQADREAAAASFAPSASRPDPSKDIPGVVTANYAQGAHVRATERVAYDHSPPFGGPHDDVWATCTGVVYPNPVRTENMVHTLEHGSVWIAYNPQQVTGDALNLLKVRVQGKPYTLMSPYPGLDKPISLQSWGHQLKLDSADDARVDEFIAALRSNPNTYPEVGASCDTATGFDPDNPPPFDASKPGPDAKPMDYKGSAGTQPDQSAGGMSQPPAAPGASTAPPASK